MSAAVGVAVGGGATAAGGFGASRGRGPRCLGVAAGCGAGFGAAAAAGCVGAGTSTGTSSHSRRRERNRGGLDGGATLGHRWWWTGSGSGIWLWLRNGRDGLRCVGHAVHESQDVVFGDDDLRARAGRQPCENHLPVNVVDPPRRHVVLPPFRLGDVREEEFVELPTRPPHAIRQVMPHGVRQHAPGGPRIVPQIVHRLPLRRCTVTLGCRRLRRDGLVDALLLLPVPLHLQLQRLAPTLLQLQFVLPCALLHLLG